MSKVEKMSFDFYYGKEADQFNFLRIPRLLFKDKRFKGLSSDAKLLYSLLLDRMSLSTKNGWIDDENRVYIYFTVKEVMDELNMAKEKCTKVFAELDKEKGCGLIIKVRQGLGKPDKIYVMNFLSCNLDEDNNTDFQEAENETFENQKTRVLKIENQEFRKSKNKKFENRETRSSEIEIPEVRKSNLKSFENQTSRGSETENQEVRKSKSNNTDINNTDNNYTDCNDINPISSYQYIENQNTKDVMDEIDEREKYKKLITENIDFDIIAKNYSLSEAEGILDIIVDAVCSKKYYLRVKEELLPQVVVKNKLLKLDYSHVEYVLDCLKNNSTEIHNIQSYILTALYNASATIDQYYATKVNQDLYGNV